MMPASIYDTTRYGTIVSSSSNTIFVIGSMMNTTASENDTDIFLVAKGKDSTTVSSIQHYGSTGEDVATGTCFYASGPAMIVAGTTTSNATGVIDANMILQYNVALTKKQAQYGGPGCSVEYHSVSCASGTLVSVGIVSGCLGQFENIPCSSGVNLFVLFLDYGNLTANTSTSMVQPLGNLPFEKRFASSSISSSKDVVYIITSVGPGASVFNFAGNSTKTTTLLIKYNVTDYTVLWTRPIQTTVNYQDAIARGIIDTDGGVAALVLATTDIAGVPSQNSFPSNWAQVTFLFKVNDTNGSPIIGYYINETSPYDEPVALQTDARTDSSVYVMFQSGTTASVHKYFNYPSIWGLDWTLSLSSAGGADLLVLPNDSEQRFWVSMVDSSGTMSGITNNTILVEYSNPMSSPSPTPSPVSPSPAVISPSSSSTSSNNNNNRKGMDKTSVAIIATFVPFAALVLVALIIVLFLMRRKKKNQNSHFGAPMADLRVSKKPLTEIKDIEIGAKIGAGNFGEVYKGKWQGTTDVALKKLKNKNLQEEFFSEASLMQRLSMPNIVRFFGIFVDKEGFSYMVSEFMSKGSLVDVLRMEKANLTLADLLYMALDAAAGMKYIASKGVIHRDLAARNLLVASSSEEKKRFTVKVADFGLSRLMMSSYYTTTGAVFPVKWSPPEVMTQERYSVKSDVWSFGVVLWEIFKKGDIPYPGKTNDEAMQLVLGGYRLPQPEDCPNEVYVVMQACWAEDPKDRPDFEYIFQTLRNYMVDSVGKPAEYSFESNANFGQESSAFYQEGLTNNSYYHNQ